MRALLTGSATEVRAELLVRALHDLARNYSLRWSGFLLLAEDVAGPAAVGEEAATLLGLDVRLGTMAEADRLVLWCGLCDAQWSARRQQWLDAGRDPEHVLNLWAIPPALRRTVLPTHTTRPSAN